MLKNLLRKEDEGKMIKYYCDRCGKDFNNSIDIHNVKIPNERHSASFSAKTVQLCRDCKKAADNLLDKLTDIHFLLFRDFMKEEGDE